MINFSALIKVISFLGVSIGSVLLINSFVNKTSKRKSSYLVGGSFLLLLMTLFLSPPTIKLSLPTSPIETNDTGSANISGTTNKKSELSVDGFQIETDKGVFDYEVHLMDNQPKKLTFVASIGKNKKIKTIEIKPSKNYITRLNKETIKKTNTAIKLAEEKPTSQNYDAAATLVHSLSKQYDELNERLIVIKENIPIYEAVALAEKVQDKEKLASAMKLVTTATLNKNDLEKRLSIVQENVTAKEKSEQQLLSAREAVEKAELDPTDNHYEQAVSRLKELPETNEELTNRINKVKQTLTMKKEADQKIAEAKEVDKKNAENTINDTHEEETTAVGEMVLVTATGKKYHRYKCGNGTYTEASLEEANARGLTPCAKCYP